jgi:sigma-B regulation protein RsbU (phosphoserine phosphatase)
MFVTLFLGVLDLNTRQLQFASAGHTPPSLLRDASVQIVSQQDGPALGLASDQEFPLNTVELQHGDRLAIYTDGIDEAFNGQAQMFGVERFNQQLAAGAVSPIDQAGPQVFQVVDDFAGNTPQSDDITLMLLQLPVPTPLAAEISTEGDAQQSFPAGAGLASRVMQWLQEALQALQVPMESEMELILITEEIVTNMDKYAELPDGSMVRVKLSCQGDQYSLEFSDEGKAFNPLIESHRSTLGADIESAEIGGLGVHLVTQLTDQQHYQRDGDRNILHIVKSMDADQPGNST